MTVNKCDEIYEEKCESEYCTENRPVMSAYSVSIDSSISKRTVAVLRRPASIPSGELQSEPYGLPILLYGVHGSHSLSGHAAIQID